MKKVFVSSVQSTIHKLFLSYTRDFPVHRGKSRLIQLLWKPLTFGYSQQTVTMHPTNVMLECDLTKFIQRQIYFRGIYEPELINLWCGFARQSRMIFDIGANIGLYSLMASSVNSLSQIHAFEPTPNVVDLLAKNIQLNRFRNIQVNAIAVGCSIGKAFLHSSSGHNGDNEGMNFITPNNFKPNDLVVEVTSITNYCRNNFIDFVDLIKIDIEGGEYDALVGADSLLATHTIGCIFLELVEWTAQRGGSSTKLIKEFLLDRKYNLYYLKHNQLISLAKQDNSAQNIIALAQNHPFDLKKIQTNAAR